MNTSLARNTLPFPSIVLNFTLRYATKSQVLDENVMELKGGSQKELYRHLMRPETETLTPLELQLSAEHLVILACQVRDQDDLCSLGPSEKLQPGCVGVRLDKTSPLCRLLEIGLLNAGFHPIVI